MYAKAMRDMIYEGGDTDTNACILGGMVGAALGVEHIPKTYIDIILNCSSTRRLNPE